jgi:hypothetical protein
VFGKSLCTYKRCWKWCPRASIQACTRLILFANNFCRSACEMFLMYTVIAVFNSLSVRGRSGYTADFAAPYCDEVQVFQGIFQQNCSCTKSVYLLPSRKTYSTRKTRSSIERTIVSKICFKQLNTLPVLHFSRCLTAEYSAVSHNSSTLQRQLRYWQPNLRTIASVHSDFPNALYKIRAHCESKKDWGHFDPMVPEQG